MIPTVVWSWPGGPGVPLSPDPAAPGLILHGIVARDPTVREEAWPSGAKASGAMPTWTKPSPIL